MKIFFGGFARKIKIIEYFCSKSAGRCCLGLFCVHSVEFQNDLLF